MEGIPKRLGKEPLVEAIWECRFDTAEATEILPGMLFSKLKE